jgi:hypothetical protein
MPSNSIKCKGNLGKIIPVALKYLIYDMQNSPCGTPQAHGSDLAPVKYPTGVTDCSRKYFSWHALPLIYSTTKTHSVIKQALLLSNKASSSSSQGTQSVLKCTLMIIENKKECCNAFTPLGLWDMVTSVGYLWIINAVCCLGLSCCTLHIHSHGNAIGLFAFHTSLLKIINASDISVFCVYTCHTCGSFGKISEM